MTSDAIVELPRLVGEMGLQPISVGPLPPPVRGLIQAMGEYERLAAEAILDEVLAAHRDLLPQFRSWRGALTIETTGCGPNS